MTEPTPSNPRQPNPRRPDPSPSEATAAPAAPTGRNYWPLGIVGMLLTVVVANVIMVSIAHRTPPILESDNAYEAGQKHDAVLAERAAAAALGWQVEVRQAPDGLWWTLRDSAGKPVVGLAGQVSLSRADTEQHDAIAAFEEVEPGDYRATWAGVPGHYRARVELTREAERWIATRQMNLK